MRLTLSPPIAPPPSPFSSMPHPLQRLARIAVICCTDEASDINRMFRAGQTAEAFAKLDQLLKTRPKDPQLRFLKGVMQADSQRRAEATSTFLQLTIDYPELPEPYNNLAVIHAAQGDYDKARAALEAALRAHPGYAAAHQNLGDVYVQLARQSYAQALQLEPGNPAIPPKLVLLRQLTQPVAAPAAKLAQPTP
jgi:Flp pilus assembly protein TadD